MSVLINKKTLEYLTELSRIEFNERDEEKLLKDIQKILDYFEELKNLNTENIEPMTGGMFKKNAFRNDGEAFVERQTPPVQLTGQFPEKENGFLKVPPVFE